jgi:hypothetical protein
VSTADWIALGSAIVSVLALLGTIYFSNQAGSHASRANLIAVGELETSLRTAISTARTRAEDAGLRIEELLNGRPKAELSVPEKKRLEFQEKAFKSSLEDYLNAYEDACSKYVDKKIDCDRFRKFYFSEIRTICEGSKAGTPMYELIHPEGTSKYQAIWKIYHEWYTQV